MKSPMCLAGAAPTLSTLFSQVPSEGLLLDHICIPTRILDGDFAGWLRDAMKTRDISTRMLELRTGIDHSTIYRLALGQRQPTLATAVALLRILTDDAEQSVTNGNGQRAVPPDLSLL